MEQQQTVDQECVVLKVGIQLGMPVLVRAEQSAGTVHQLIEQEPAACLRNLPVVVPVQNDRRLGEGGEHEAIP